MKDFFGDFLAVAELKLTHTHPEVTHEARRIDSAEIAHAFDEFALTR